MWSAFEHLPWIHCSQHLPEISSVLLPMASRPPLPQKSLHNVSTCSMSLKEEGTHSHDFKINSRRQSSLVLGLPSASEVIALSGLLPQCAWRPLRFGSDWLLLVEGWVGSQMTTAISTTAMMSCGKTSWQSSAMGFPLADLSASLSFLSFLFFGMKQNNSAINWRGPSTGLPSNTGQTYAGCLGVLQDYSNKSTTAEA